MIMKLIFSLALPRMWFSNAPLHICQQIGMKYNFDQLLKSSLSQSISCINNMREHNFITICKTVGVLQPNPLFHKNEQERDISCHSLSLSVSLTLSLSFSLFLFLFLFLSLHFHIILSSLHETYI
jgi:hypothetical protein